MRPEERLSVSTASRMIAPGELPSFLRAEEGFRSLVEHLPVVVYVDALEGTATPVYISPAIERVLGFTVEEWLATPDMWIRQLHPGDRERVLAAAEESNRTAEPFVEEYRSAARDGRWVWIHEESVLIRDPEGTPLHWQGVMLDISAQRDAEVRRREAEERLREVEDRFRTLVESIPAITYIDEFETGETAYLSPQAETVLGYTANEWNNAYWRSIVHPGDRERVFAEDARTDETGEPFRMEYRMSASDGRVVWVRDEAILLRDAEGRPAFWQGVMYDVTQQKEAEERLRVAEAKYRSVAENIPAVVYIEPVEEGLGTDYVSPQFEAIAGYPPERLTEEEGFWESILHPDDRERVLAEDRRSFETGEPFNTDLRIVRADGEVVWVHDEAVLIRDEDGTPLFWQGFFHDITQKKQAEEELERALVAEREAAEQLRALDEMKNAFLTAVSHELRTPVSAILGSALTLDQLDDSVVTAEDRNGLVKAIIGKAQKLNGLITDLLDIDRLTRGIIEPRRRPMDVAEVVHRTLADIGLSSDRRLIVATEPVMVAGDPSMVERIVENLLSNAWRYTPPGTTVWVRAEAADGGAFLVVEDDGPGIPEEIRDELFEPFRQGPNAIGHSPGVGVGLSLVARFAELHGGWARVGVREGGGASFRVFLPDTATPAPGV